MEKPFEVSKGFFYFAWVTPVLLNHQNKSNEHTRHIV